MGLTSDWTILFVIVLAMAGGVSCFACWNRFRRHRVVQFFSRALLFGGSQLLLLVLAALLLNNHFRFYASWSELLGRPSLTAASAPPAVGRIDHFYVHQVRAGFRDGHGTVISMVIPGTASGTPAQRALVYLPAAYGDPAAPSAQFPVVELLHGFPGSPESWTGPLHLRAVLDAQIATRHSVPMIAVMPMQNLAFPRDTQCVNVIGGVQVDTFLTRDVHRAVLQSLRADSGRGGWSIMGYSIGGYCALNLAMRHPDLYGSAVSLSGYAKPAHDYQTGALFGGNIAVRNANSPLWRAQHSPPPALSALVMTGRQDSGPYRDAVQFAAAARAPMTVCTVAFSGGGHNFSFWRSLEPYAFAWLSRHLSAPLAPLAPPVPISGPTIAIAQGASHRAP